MNINVVRFKEPLYLGTQMDIRSSLAKGDAVLGVPVELSVYNDLFMRVHFKAGSNSYSQLIPWASIATILYDEKK